MSLSFTKVRKFRERLKNQLLWPFNFLRYLFKIQVELSRELRGEVWAD